MAEVSPSVLLRNGSVLCFRVEFRFVRDLSRSFAIWERVGQFCRQNCKARRGQPLAFRSALCSVLSVDGGFMYLFMVLKMIRKRTLFFIYFFEKKHTQACARAWEWERGRGGERNL